MTYYFSLFVLGNFLAVYSVIIQPKGPTHRNFAIKCIKEIAEDAIDFVKSKYPYYPQLLLTYVVTINLDSPAYDIQEEGLKLIHRQRVWLVEVLENDRQGFQSYEDNCDKFAHDDGPSGVHQEEGCTRKPVRNYKTQFYIMVVENLENFNTKFELLTNSSSYSAEALYLIYISKVGPENINIATEVVSKLKGYTPNKFIVMAPKNLTTFDMYRVIINNERGIDCYSNMTTEISHQCIKGTIMRHDTNLFQKQSDDNFHQCIFKVNAILYEPFVINSADGINGIEIDILHELGRALNISFDIEISNLSTSHLGYKDEEGEWNGFLEPIYNSWHYGVGNIAPEDRLMSDFTYSVPYYSEQIVWVVPIAGLIPTWRVLTVIFTLEMWGICLTVIFGFAIFFYLSKTETETVTFKTFEKCFAAAFQLVLGVPVPRQPITHFTRVFFIGLAIFGIIINSIYTCSLIKYLQNAVRESQISTDIEIARSGLLIGGPGKYKEMFGASSGPLGQQILSRYQTVNDTLDTYSHWLYLVGKKRNIATFAVKVCVAYLISKKKSIVTDRHGNPKVYMLPEDIMSQSIGIIMRRGEFAEKKVNSIIQKLIVEAGVVEKIKSDYLRAGTSDDDDDDDDDNDDGVTALSTHHLEGAFAIFALGQCFGLLALIIEIIYFAIRKKIK